MYLKDLLRYRNAWLGFAMVWIIWFHTSFGTGVAAIDIIKQMGYAGVDICLFASGIGCYYSLSSDSDAFSFMKRRLKRIMPTYLIFIVLWLVYKLAMNEFDLYMAIGNIFAIENFTGSGKDFNWYITAILFLYILAPYFKSMVDRSSFVKNVVILLLLCVVSVPFWFNHTLIITVTRLPIYYVGMMFAKACREDKKITCGYTWSMVLMGLIGIGALAVAIVFFSKYLWNCGLYWYPFILITPPLCMGISYLSSLFEKIRGVKGIVSLFSLIGNYSFEVYLLHIPLLRICKDSISFFELENYSVLIFGAGLVCLVAGSFVLRKLTLLYESIRSKKISKNI